MTLNVSSSKCQRLAQTKTFVQITKARKLEKDLAGSKVVQMHKISRDQLDTAKTNACGSHAGVVSLGKSDILYVAGDCNHQHSPNNETSHDYFYRSDAYWPRVEACF